MGERGTYGLRAGGDVKGAACRGPLFGPSPTARITLAPTGQRGLGSPLLLHLEYNMT